MSRRFRPIAPAAGLFFPLLADAHTGSLAGPVSGWVSGLVHPFMGVDHLLAMLAVGMWAGQLGGRAQWQVPASFIAFMAAGAVLAISGAQVPATESGILASLIVFGLLLATAFRVPATAGNAGIGLFALFHGAAHGLEMPPAFHPIAYAAGFVLATTTLHIVGLCITRLCNQRVFLLVPRLAGAAIAGVGVLLSLIAS